MIQGAQSLLSRSPSSGQDSHRLYVAGKTIDIYFNYGYINILIYAVLRTEIVILKLLLPYFSEMVESKKKRETLDTLSFELDPDIQKQISDRNINNFNNAML